jgi:hypothetical protein
MRSEFGLVAGQAFDFDSLEPSQRAALKSGMNHGVKLLNSYPGRVVDGWSQPDMRTGNYSDDYLLRAYIAYVLYAANVPQDAVYFVSEMLPNDGRVYELNLTVTPPTNAFWSITLYSADGYLVANENRTYSVSSQQNLKYGPHGSVHITLSMSQPEVKNTNWLPTPQAGEAFQLTFRVYWPGEAVLRHAWMPPPIVEVTGA